MTRRSLAIVLVLSVVFVLLVGACGDSGSDVKTTSPVATTLTQPTATAADAAEATTVPQEPTAASEPTATTEPTATPEPAGEADVIVGKWKVAENSIGGVYFFGEAINQGTADASDVKVVVTLRDASGGVLASEQANLTSISIIPAGEMRPFKGIISSVDMTAVATQDAQIQFKTYDDNAILAGFYSAAFDVQQPEWTADHVTGEIINTGESAVQYIMVSAIGYDDAGEVVAVETGSPSLDPLDAGASSPFDITLYSMEPVVPATFQVFASGHTVESSTSSPTESPAEATTAPPADAQPTTPISPDLEKALITLGDLPAGWTAEEPSESSSDGPGFCNIEQDSNGNPATGKAEAEFSAGQLGPALSQSLAEFDGDGAKSNMQLLRDSTSCGSWADEDGTEWTLTEMSFPDLGDEVFAVKISATSDGFDIGGDMVVVRDNNVIILVTQLGLLGSVDSSLTEQVVRTSLDRLN